MPKISLPKEIAEPSVDVEAVVDRIISQADPLTEVFGGLRSDTPKIRYGCLKVLRLISEKNPAVLYPEFDRLVELLDRPNNIFKWGAIIILGNLATVDSANKIDRMLDRYLEPISGPVMITAANTIGGAGKIALAKPQFADQIARALLQVEAADYHTPECRNVALGHAVKALDLFFAFIRDRQPVLAFVERQLRNPRNAVKRKAAAFLKKHQQITPSPAQEKLPVRLDTKHSRSGKVQR
jgi:hypothetical protein